MDWEESLRVALRCGLSVTEYNDLTPRELFLFVEDYNIKKDQHNDELLILAYTTAKLSRVRRLPNLDNLLEDRRKQRVSKKKTQTDEDMLRAVKRMQEKLSREG